MECTTEEFEGTPTEILSYFHSTPARYVVQAAHSKGFLGTPNSDDYVLARLVDYVCFGPANLFQVFARLHLADRDDLQSRLFDDPKVVEAICRFVESAPSAPTGAWLEGLARTLLAIGQWKGNSGPVARAILDAFLHRFSAQERSTILTSADARIVLLLTRATRLADPHLADELLFNIDYVKLGLRSCDVAVQAIRDLLPAARQAGVSIENLNAFCDGVDFSRLGKRSRDKSISIIKNFLINARQAGVSTKNIDAFCDRIDFKGLGERSRDTGITNINLLLQAFRQYGVKAENINTFCDGLDFRGLGKRSHDTSSNTVRGFLFEVERIGVSTKNLTAFCDGLDLQRLGRKLALTINEQSPFWTFHTVMFNRGVSITMARAFVEGLGWAAVQSILKAPNTPDVVAALSSLLGKKCGYDQATLQQFGIDFDSETWLSSFIERGCTQPQPAQQAVQQIYLQLALNGLRGYPSLPLQQRLLGHQLSLQNWNILIHNIKLADPEFLRAELEPLLRDISPAEWARLVRDADLMNLSIFAAKFAPESGDFTWRPHLDPAFGEPDFASVVGRSDLTATAHGLFNLRHLGKPDWCAAIADALDRDSESVLPKIAAADLQTTDLFLWNLLTARHDLQCPALLNSPGIGAAICEVATKYSKEQVNLAALCGTLHLWGWQGLGELMSMVKGKLVIEHCLTAAKSKSPSLIRLAAGIAAISPIGFSAAARQAITDGLGSLAISLAFSSQVLALERSRTWIEKMGDT